MSAIFRDFNLFFVHAFLFPVEGGGGGEGGREGEEEKVKDE